MTGPGRSEAGRSGPARARARKHAPAGRRANAALRPPPGLEASLIDVGSEELLVLRIPVIRETVDADLSDAERDVARLALAGLSNAEIGRRRGTRERTVANQLAAIFKKLGVGSRAELALRFVRKSPG